ncbi:MAG: metallophosphoesterase, partial [Candidatus Hydrogenedentes bacterium]|nr:metallophosphoesterase [Candidatus Hydrogenedentota bacterium]
MTRRAQLIFLSLVLALGAWAREPDATLGLIRAPHEGMPVLLGNTLAFDVVLREKADDVRIERDGSSIALSTQWSEVRGMWHGLCQLPQDVPAGAYALAADAKGQTDRNVRSVFVYASFPESYRFAQLTDIHVGADREWGHGADVFRKAIETCNASDAAFALLTGDLTDNAGPDQYRQFIEILNTCTLPTFLTPGNHDSEQGEYGRVFGDAAYAFHFGPDAYLS